MHSSLRRPLLAVAAGLFCLLLSLPALAVPTPKTLLWRITGKGLSQPSYLYGTMHLSDKRLFHFDDSVYHALETSAGMAIEVSPDEMITYFINRTFDNMVRNDKKLSELLDDETYKEYAPALAKKLHKPADEITAKDMVAEKHKWVNNYLNKGEMPTFVDAYLYNIARQQGKWLGGIEDISDQADIMDNIVDKSDIKIMSEDARPASKSGRGFVEDMIELYTSQDVDAMYTMTESGPSLGLLALNRRNLKMARRMDSLSAMRPMFFAVGAAHLGGDSGVIRLLRERGFTVAPVMGSKKIHADDYTFKRVPVQWQHVKDAESLYDADMPGNPVDVKVFGVTDSKFMFDLFNMTGYCTMAVPADGESDKPNSIYDGLADRIFKGAPSKFTTIEKGGVRGREYVSTSSKLNARVQVFASGTMMYLAMAYTLRKEAIKGEDVNRFLQSFRIHPEQIAKDAGNVYAFTSPSGNVRISSPVRLTYSRPLSSNEDGNPWEVRTYTGTDGARKALVMLLEKRLKPGYFLYEDSSLLPELCETMHAKYNSGCEPEAVQGYPARRMNGKSKDPELETRILAIQRGNQTVMVMEVGEHVDAPELKQVFSSTRLLPYATPIFTMRRGPDGTYSTAAPGPLTTHTTHADPPEHYVIAYDSSSSTTFFVETDTLTPYYWMESKAAFWKKMQEHYTGDEHDSLIYARTIHHGADEGREWLTKRKSSGIHKRIQLSLHGNVLYILSASGDVGVIGNTASDRFFSDFTAHTVPALFDIAASKANLLLRNLSSSDSATRANAYSAISDAPFTKSDVPALHKALLGHYPGIYSWQDANEESYMVNNSLATAISGLDKAATTAFVKEKYPTLRGRDTGLRPVLQRLLADTKTRESYTTLATLIAATPGTGDNYYVRFRLRDSLPLLRDVYPSFIPLLKRAETAPLAIGITRMLADSSYVKAPELKKLQADFIREATARLTLLRAADSNVMLRDYDMVHVLRHINSPEATASLAEYLHVPSHALASVAAIELLHAGAPVTSDDLLPIAADSTVSTELYDELDAMNKTSLFPTQYKTQQHFAAAMIYSLSSDEDNELIGLMPLGRRKHEVNGKEYLFYIYKVTIKTEDEDGYASYLGIAGAYENGYDKLRPSKELSGINWSDKFDKSKVKEQLASYLASLEQSEGSEASSD